MSTVRLVVGWAYIALRAMIHPARGERTYHETPVDLAGAGSESLPRRGGTVRPPANPKPPRER